MPAAAAAEDGAQFKVLECVGQEIACAKDEDFWIEIVVVAGGAARGGGAGGGGGVGVLAIEGVCIERGLVRRRGADAGKPGAEGSCVGVSVGQGERDIGGDCPGVGPVRMQ